MERQLAGRTRWQRCRELGSTLGRCLNLPWLPPFSRRLLLTGPLAAGALAVGFAAQGLMASSRGTADDDRLLAALVASPTTTTTASRSAAGTAAGGEERMAPTQDQLSGLQAERAASAASQRLDLVEPGAGAPVALEIRVALLGAAGQPRLGASGPWQLLSRDGRLLQQGSAGDAVALGALPSGLAEAWLQTSSGVLLVDGQAYAGRLRLLLNGSGVELVNHLSLEDYVASVVGAEMPSSWNMEALRAQAVAARSYALAHMARPASRHWHLGNTTRWQAYRGLASVSERTRQAAASTAGLILSYQGGIVESLYASTQQISSEAHGHLGASMSQHGAQDLAEQGLRYNQILGRYYQGASLARLKAGAG
ncbi:MULTISPECIES: SpoIID/LytB domain-containing protein [unclassified Synechococcus]|nr:SpoIID/LytB domain-containing protein [Synechococcus sp. CBW1107]